MRLSANDGTTNTHSSSPINEPYRLIPVPASPSPTARHMSPPNPKALRRDPGAASCEVVQANTAPQANDMILTDSKNNSSVTTDFPCVRLTEDLFGRDAESPVLETGRSDAMFGPYTPKRTKPKIVPSASDATCDSLAPGIQIRASLSLKTSLPSVPSSKASTFIRPVAKLRPKPVASKVPPFEDSRKITPLTLFKQPMKLAMETYPLRRSTVQSVRDPLVDSVVSDARILNSINTIPPEQTIVSSSNSFADSTQTIPFHGTRSMSAPGFTKRKALHSTSEQRVIDGTVLPATNKTPATMSGQVDGTPESSDCRINICTKSRSLVSGSGIKIQKQTYMSSIFEKSSVSRAQTPVERKASVSPRENSNSEEPLSNSLLADVSSPRGSICVNDEDEGDQDVAALTLKEEDSDGVLNGDAAEALALLKYVYMKVADLHKSTYRKIGTHLSISRTLRVINLKSCTIQNEGLLGLAEIPSLEVVCVSHMRQLTSLKPLITRRGGLLATIREINAQCTSVNNDGIVGLEMLIHLHRLDLSFTCVTSVSLMRQSPSLIELNLTATHVTAEGISGLEEIRTLRALNISRTKVCTLQGISKSNSLEKLTAYSCNIDNSGLCGVEKMPNLQALDISTSKVSNMSILSASKSIKSITAQWLPLQNCVNIIRERRSRRSDDAFMKLIDGVDEERPRSKMRGDAYKASTDSELGYRSLAGIPTLEHVDLSFNAIRSVKTLFASKSINSIVLRRTFVDSDGIKGIHNLRTLRKLVITNATDQNICDSYNCISSGSQVSGVLTTFMDLHLVPHLTILDLSFTDIYDVRMLSVLPHLKELILVETLITVDGLLGIERLPALQTLDISQNSVISLQFLCNGCATLRKLLVKSNRCPRGFHLGNIQCLPALETLNISDTVVEDIHVLFRRTSALKEFIWRWGERRDSTGHVDSLPCWVTTARLMGIECMQHLQFIDITNSEVESLTFLSTSKSLRRLVAAHCVKLGNKGIVGLERILTLEEVDFSHASGITDVQCLASSRSLQQLKIGWTGVTRDGIKGISTLPTLKNLVLTYTEAEVASVSKSMEDSFPCSTGRNRANTSILKESRTGSIVVDNANFKIRTLHQVSFVT